MKLTIVAGARPNFMKIAPVIHAIQKTQKKNNLTYRLVHTGQHYDKKMSDTFFDELNIPQPDINLAVGGGTQAEQTAGIMVEFEKELNSYPTDLVLVVGDVTSTMACSIVAKKMNIKVAHIEAGIRSFDLSMPEEINRMVTDSIADYFFTTTQWASDNLLRNGVKENCIFLVGNVMIDTLVGNMDRLRKPKEYDLLQLKEKEYIVLTMHRPGNVDESQKLKATIMEIVKNSPNTPIVFPIHPRTAKMLSELSIEADNLKVIEPLGYLEFNYLVRHSKGVITDSGGITEETSFMRVPCITLRNNTERPETCEIGTNELIGTAPSAISPTLKKLFLEDWKEGGDIPLWDGKAAQRIVEVLGALSIQS